MERPQHVPVLLEESLEFLAVHPGGVYADATLGLGGHSAEIARRLGPKGKLIAFDRDPEALSKAQAKLEALAQEPGPGMPTVEYVSRPFSEIADVIPPGTLDGLLADFGVSSLQLDEAHRGFSFRAEGPLDMRMDPRSSLTAEQVVNQADEEELANLIYEFGEERRSRRIARAIVRARPISTTAELARVVSAVAPPIKKSDRSYGKSSQIHPATRTFQALRIRVNDELQEIQSLLRSAGSLLKPGGRLVLISFHSLEDRLVKDALRDGAKAGQYELLTKKPVVATDEESFRNPRSRSAKLRSAQKI
ncbi:MAG TPA: 16S rRNA (cytosine(1402)-N(4))-methyltransferase RsmH [Bryocella sp.]|nr:16S rRNA (cytosine(1402)-N(4))-methyltransferase RsmH [Bryocella sp.]